MNTAGTVITGAGIISGILLLGMAGGVGIAANIGELNKPALVVNPEPIVLQPETRTRTITKVIEKKVEVPGPTKTVTKTKTEYVNVYIPELPACEYEDSDNCIWDATSSGNGVGHSFIAYQGNVYYLEG